MSHELLKVNVLVHCGDLFHVDTLDLYSARQRAAFTKHASEELRMKEETLRRDLGRVLLQLEKLQDEQIRKALTPEKPEARMNDEERAEALALLRDPKLLDRILEHFTDCGMVGEETNKLVGYLAAVSRHLEAPLAVVVQSSVGGGKKFVDGCGAGVRAGRRAHSILGDDGPGALLHGRDGSEAQGAGHRGRRRREPRGVCVEAAAERRLADDRFHRQRSGDRANWSRISTAWKGR